MLNYIKADFYRIFRKKSFYVFLAFCSLGFILSNFIVSGVGYSVETYMGLSSLLLTFAPIFVGIFVFSAVYTDDLRSKSLQTAIGFGRKRSEIVIVKFIDAILLMLIFTTLIAIHIHVVPLLFGLSLTKEVTTILNVSILTVLLKTTGYFALASLAVFSLQKSTPSMTFFVLFSTGTIHMLVSLILSQNFIVKLFGDLSPYLLTSVINTISSNLIMNSGSIVSSVLILGGYIVGALGLSILAFNHKELEF